MKKTILPTLTLTLFLLSNSLFASLILNGDFSVDDVDGQSNDSFAFWTSTTYDPNYPTGGWLTGQYDGGSNLTFNIADLSGNNIIVQNNADTANDSGSDGLMQVIDISGMTAADAGTYTLSFDWRANSANLSGFSYGIWSTTAPSSGGRFVQTSQQSPPSWPNPKSFVDSTSISAIAADTFQTETTTFELTASDIATYDYLALSFQSNALGDTQLAFDNVSVVIPEPSPIILMLGVFGMLLLRRRR